MTYHPRSEWNPLSPYSVTGPPADWSKIDTAVVHYTAADDLIDGDPGEHAEDLPAYLANIQTSYAKPKEQGGRGYSIGYMFAVDWLGGIWQLRGWEYQSAANKGHNEHTMPILLLVDGDDPATAEAAAAVRWLISEGQRRSTRTYAIKGHGQLRVETGVGTATACPGVGLQAQVTAGVFTPRPDPIVPSPPFLLLGGPMQLYPVESGNRRLFDSRPTGPAVKDQTIRLSVGDLEAQHAFATVTIVGIGTAGYVENYPGSSCVNWTPDTGVIATSTLFPVTDGHLTFTVRQGGCHFIVDLLGVFR